MDEARIRAELRGLYRRRKNIRFRELASLLDNHIGPLFGNYNHHGSPHHAFTLGSKTFNIAEPRRGDSVKRCYVNQFFHAMESLGLFSPEEEDEDC